MCDVIMKSVSTCFIYLFKTVTAVGGSSRWLSRQSLSSYVFKMTRKGLPNLNIKFQLNPTHSLGGRLGYSQLEVVRNLVYLT